jgi:hypothetical protein
VSIQLAKSFHTHARRGTFLRRHPPLAPEDDALSAADLDQVAGGVLSAGGTGAQSPAAPGGISAGSLGGAGQMGGPLNATKIVFTGEEVDSQ